MFVGVARIRIQIPGARSLKDKRSVVRSFKERVQAKLKVSIAEVGALDALQHAIFGVAVVSNEAALCDELLASVAHMASTLRDAVLTDHTTETLPFGVDARGVQGDGIQNTPVNPRNWDDSARGSDSEKDDDDR